CGGLCRSTSKTRSQRRCSRARSRPARRLSKSSWTDRNCTTVGWTRRRQKACCCTRIRQLSAVSYQPSVYAGGFVFFALFAVKGFTAKDAKKIAPRAQRNFYGTCGVFIALVSRLPGSQALPPRA